MHKEADTHQTNTAERERVEKALRVAIESFDILFDHAPVMMHAVDKDGRLVRVNSRWLQTLGYESSEVLGPEEYRVPDRGITHPGQRRAGSFLARWVRSQHQGSVCAERRADSRYLAGCGDLWCYHDALLRLRHSPRRR